LCRRVTRPSPIKVADLQTLIPAGVGNFTSFAAVACNDAGTTLFNGSGANGQSGLFTFAGSVLETIVTAGDSLPIGAGETFALINGVPPNPCRISNGNVAFIATGANAFQGVYLSIGTTGQFANIASTFRTIPTRPFRSRALAGSRTTGRSSRSLAAPRRLATLRRSLPSAR
jgi:hypothetical protein